MTACIIQEYELIIESGDDASLKPISRSVHAPAMDITVPGLLAGHVYLVTVRAICLLTSRKLVISAASVEAKVSTPIEAPRAPIAIAEWQSSASSPPETVAELERLSSQCTVFRIQWEPSELGLRMLRRHEVQIARGPDDTSAPSEDDWSAAIAVEAGSELSYRWEGLVSGSRVCYGRVRAVTDQGESAWSKASAPVQLPLLETPAAPKLTWPADSDSLDTLMLMWRRALAVGCEPNRLFVEVFQRRLARVHGSKKRRQFLLHSRRSFTTSPPINSRCAR